MKLKIIKLKTENLNRGFSIFIAVVIMGALLLAAYSISYLSSKELRLTTTNRESQYAYFAADAGIECALYWDSKSNPSKFDPTSDGSPITCNGQSISTGAAIAGTSTTALIGGGGGSPFTNFALASNGGVSSASGDYGDGIRTAATINNGDRIGTPDLYWRSCCANSWGDWVRIDFSGPKTIQEIDVFSGQDGPNSSWVQPTPGMTFDPATTLNATDFYIQYSTDGTNFNNIPGASVSGNNLVWKQFTFSPISNVSAIRMFVTGGNVYPEVVELEAWGGGGNNPPSVFGFSLNSAQNPVNSCAVVTVYKDGAGGTDVNSYGYNTCNVSDPKRVERGIEVKY